MLGVEEQPVEPRPGQQLRDISPGQRAPEPDLRPPLGQRPLEPVPRQVHQPSLPKCSPWVTRIRARMLLDPPEMRPHRRHRRLRVAGPHRRQDRPVIVERLPAPRSSGSGTAPGPCAPSSRGSASRRTRGRTSAQIRRWNSSSSAWNRSRSSAATAAACAASSAVERRELRRPEPRRGDPHRLDLERRPHEARLLHRPLGDGADLGRALRPDGQEPELRQPPEGVAHRLPRHPRRPRHLGLRQPRPRRQRQRHHLLVERLEHPVRRRRRRGPRRSRTSGAASVMTPSVDSDCILAY